MAQKKVILKDGADELLPKTSASMVFTESGQTVEAALQNAGTGGGGTGGGIDEEQLAQYLQQHQYVTKPALNEAHYLTPTSEITGYTKASNYTALAPTDTMNEALGKLEAGIGSGGSGGDGEDDVYYLPINVVNLEVDCTEEEFLEAFGGEDGINELKNAVSNSKKIYIKSASIYNYRLIPVSCFFVFDILSLTFLAELKIGDFVVRNIHITLKTIRDIYLEGYTLNNTFYNLTSNSNTDVISSAVNGESGLKKIIKAIEDGNRLVIRDKTGGFNQDLSVSLYSVEDNGNMMLMLSGIGYGLWGGVGGFLTINYTKSSNTFSCTVTPISMGS